MRGKENHKEAGSKGFQRMKESEYRAIEHMNIRPAARKRFQHKPYSNDFGRNDSADESTN